METKRQQRKEDAAKLNLWLIQYLFVKFKFIKNDSKRLKKCLNDLIFIALGYSV